MYQRIKYQQHTSMRWQIFSESDISAIGVFGQIYDVHAQKLLFLRIRNSSDIAIRFSDPDSYSYRKRMLAIGRCLPMF